MIHVHESNACAGGETKGRHARAVDVDDHIHKGWAVIFLVSDDPQSWNAVLYETFVIQAVELAVAGDVSQPRIETIEIQWLVEQPL